MTTDPNEVDPRLTSENSKFFTESNGWSCVFGGAVTGLTCSLLLEGSLDTCLLAAFLGWVITVSANAINSR